MGSAALGKVLARLGRDREAETAYDQAVQTLETIAANLETPHLRRTLCNAAPVLEVYAALGHHSALVLP